MQVEVVVAEREQHEVGLVGEALDPQRLGLLHRVVAADPHVQHFHPWPCMISEQLLELLGEGVGHVRDAVARGGRVTQDEHPESTGRLL